MNPRVVTLAERPELQDSWEDVVRPVWPEFMLHDEVVAEHWHHLETHFPEFQLYLLDSEADRVLGIGNTIPFAWDGALAGLPEGIDGVLPRAIDQRLSDVPPTTLCALQAVVRPDAQGGGLSGRIIQGMAGIAARHGLAALVAPVRPTRKSDYPLVPMERYVRWSREDGLPLDPWIRLHARLGAEILRVAHASMTIRGSVSEWEEWTGMAFPDSGPYVVPGALVPVEIDLERDEGRYHEPNVWMRHAVPPGRFTR